MSADPAPADSPLRVVTLRRVDFPETLARIALGSVQFVAFWTAALLPFAYLPLLATGAVESHPAAFGALLATNAVAFVVGHGYRRDARDGRDARDAAAPDA